MKSKRYDLNVLPSEITSESVYFGRRRVAAALAGWGLLAPISAIAATDSGSRDSAAVQAKMQAAAKSTYSVCETVTPIEVAGGYTIFANRGVFVKPNWISVIRDDKGHNIFEYTPVRRQVLDPRVAYLMVSLMEEVLRSGTGAGTRSRGFGLPAAGKTGTSHDGWFAGFTSKLICIVWIGFDDNKELHLEGARSALPVWTEFMKRAHQYREYRGAHAFRDRKSVV